MEGAGLRHRPRPRPAPRSCSRSWPGDPASRPTATATSRRSTRRCSGTGPSRTCYKADAPPTERAHKDRILVTPDSPEAIEEVLWMRFFPRAHDTGTVQVLDAATSNPAFERFYRDHLRGDPAGPRRHALPQQGQLQPHPPRLPAEALSGRPLRRPGARALLAHRLADEAAPSVLRGRDAATRASSPTCAAPATSSSASTAAPSTSATAWRPRSSASGQDGDEVRGWARYWNSLYGFVARTAGVRSRSWARPRWWCATRTCASVRGHPRRRARPRALSDASGRSWTRSPRASPLPSYYARGFTEAERAIIAEETAEARRARVRVSPITTVRAAFAPARAAQAVWLGRRPLARSAISRDAPAARCTA